MYQEANETYIPASVLEDASLEGAPVFNSNSDGKLLVWLATDRWVTLKADFKRRCWFGADRPYWVTIPAGSRVRLRSGGDAATASVWEVVEPD